MPTVEFKYYDKKTRSTKTRRFTARPKRAGPTPSKLRPYAMATKEIGEVPRKNTQLYTKWKALARKFGARS